MLRVIVFIAIFYLIECYDDDCYGCRPRYVRTKRAKYFSSQPLKIYTRPPPSAPIRGPFSYTPPPGYMANDGGSHPSSRPYKVGKRPASEGLGDEDLKTLVKNLSKNDLDKIVEFASEKERRTERYREPSDDKYEEYPPIFNNNEVSTEEGYNIGRISSGQSSRTSEKRQNVDFISKKPSGQLNGPFVNQPAYSKGKLEEPEYKEQFAYTGAYSEEEFDGPLMDKTNIFTDSRTVKEEELPKPLNLRDDYEISYTNNVPSVAKPNPNSYKLENFGDLPLMGYEHSKLHTVSSYNVPHYSVTASQLLDMPFKSSTFNGPEVRPAPQASAAHEQGDAHLKAIKIWTHKSRGTAYTLHDDGTLTLERPRRSKYKSN